MLNIEQVICACDTLGRRVTQVGGECHGSKWLFDQCMRAFTAALPAEAITFSIFIAPPVNRPGEATIHRDGRLEMRTV